MPKIENQRLTGSHAVDGQSYVNIDFEDVVLIYSGGQPPTFDRCRFARATLSFQGPADATLQFLNSMAPAKTRMRQVVLGLIPALKD